MLSTSFDEKINPKTYEENPGKYIGLMVWDRKPKNPNMLQLYTLNQPIFKLKNTNIRIKSEFLAAQLKFHNIHRGPPPPRASQIHAHVLG